MQEIRGEVDSFEKMKRKIKDLGATYKGDYAFEDRIFYPEGVAHDLAREFTRLRIYSKTQWKQPKFELTHKLRKNGEVTATKWPLETIEEAHMQLTKMTFAFSYKRQGWEFALGNARLFLEDIEGLPPTLEIESDSLDEIHQLFKSLQPIKLYDIPVPKIVENAKLSSSSRTNAHGSKRNYHVP